MQDPNLSDGPTPRQRAPRPARRRRRGIPQSVRIGVVAVSGTLCAWCLFVVMNRVARPYVLGHDEGKKVAALRTRLDHLDSENDALRHRVTYLQSPEGAESEARHKGYHKPGEVVYLINDALLDGNTPAPNAPQ